jgi:hypothetical protein
MRLSIEAINAVSLASESTRDQLMRNLSDYTDNAMNDLAKINDVSADKCKEELNKFNAYVKATCKTLDTINELMQDYRRVHERMNQI